MRLELDARARRLLRRLPGVNAYSLVELLLLAGLAVQSARLIWAVATPVGPIGAWRAAEPVVPGDAAAILSGFDPFFRLGAPAAGPAVVTSLQLQLFGTRVNEATGGGSAIVAGPDGVQQSVSVGEEIAPGVTLKAVAFDHITVDHGGAAEDLYLDQSDAAPTVTTDAAPTPSSSTQMLIPSPTPMLVPSPSPTPSAPSAAPSGGVPASQLRSDIGFVPRIDGGRLSGLVVRPQGSGAAFRQAGLHAGDVVTAIAGRPVTGAADLDRVARDYAKGGTLPITVERGDRTLPLSIAIAPAS